MPSHTIWLYFPFSCLRWIGLGSFLWTRSLKINCLMHMVWETKTQWAASLPSPCVLPKQAVLYSPNLSGHLTPQSHIIQLNFCCFLVSSQFFLFTLEFFPSPQNQDPAWSTQELHGFRSPLLENKFTVYIIGFGSIFDKSISDCDKSCKPRYRSTCSRVLFWHIYSILHLVLKLVLAFSVMFWYIVKFAITDVVVENTTRILLVFCCLG